MPQYLLPLIALFLRYFPIIRAQSRGDIECFQPTLRRAISNLVPIEELWNVELELCLRHCIHSLPSHQICSAAVYHRHFSSCQLYGQDGTSGNSKIVVAAGHDYFLRISFAESCKTPYDKRVSQQQLSEPFFRAKGVPNYANAVVVEPSKFHAEQANSSKPVKDTRLSYLLANKPVYECGPNEKLAFFLLKSRAQGQTRPVAKLRGIDDINQCLNYCVQNRDKQNEKSHCMLASYSNAHKVCDLHDETAKELELFTRLQYSKGDIAIEKFCLSQKTPCKFGSKFEVDIGQQIVGNVIARLVGIETLSECVNLCFSSNFCKSVNYKEKECMLHRIQSSDPFANIVDTTNHKNVHVNIQCDF